MKQWDGVFVSVLTNRRKGNMKHWTYDKVGNYITMVQGITTRS